MSALHFVVVVLLQQILGHGGHNRSREQVGREHGEDNGLRQWHEEKLGYARKEEHRDEDDTDGERGNECGDSDLGCAIENRLFYCLAHLNIAIDVLDFYGSV